MAVALRRSGIRDVVLGHVVGEGRRRSVSMAAVDPRHPAEEPVQVPSEHVDQTTKLREFAAMDVKDPRRPVVREELILAFLPVVAHMARRYCHGSISVEELTQIGAVGLITAIDRWNPELGRGEFLAYLIPCVRGEILRWFRDRSWSMHVPRSLKDLSGAIARVSGPLSQELGRAPRPSELAARLGVGVDEVVDALGARASYQTAALDEVDPRAGVPFVDRWGALDGQLEKLEDRHTLRPLLARLSERERTIVMLRFFAEMTQTQIAQEVGLSQMHVSRLLARSLQQLRVGAGDRPAD
jgi:RNA polymerase sigma-B factor